MLRMKDDENIKYFFGKIMKLVNQLKLFREKMTKKRIVNKVLVSLIKKFEAKISSLEDSKDIAKLTLSELVNALEAWK